MTTGDLTDILSAYEAGDKRAADRLLEAAYDRLRALAEDKLRRERPGHALQPTALVHEAYLKLIDQDRVSWQGRTHFCAVAAQAMQRLLIDHARMEKREKRGGGWRRVALDDAFAIANERETDLVALDEALERLRAHDERMARGVALRLFGGLNAEEIARMLDVNKRTVERDWTMARAWLGRELSREPDE